MTDPTTPADTLRETELWSVLDWSLWGNGLGDTLRSEMADTMLAAVPKDQRDQAEALIRSWHERRGPSMAVGVGTKLQAERDQAIRELDEARAALSRGATDDHTYALACEVMDEHDAGRAPQPSVYLELAARVIRHTTPTTKES